MSAEGDFGLDADDLAARARVEDAADRRRRAQWQRDLSRYDLSIDAALLGSLGRPASIGLSDGTTLTAMIDAVGHDVVDLTDTATGQRHWVRLAAIVQVSSDRLSAGSEAERADSTLASLCDDLAHRGIEVTATTATSAIRGEVLASGAALVLTLRGGPTTTAIRWEMLISVRL